MYLSLYVYFKNTWLLWLLLFCNNYIASTELALCLSLLFTCSWCVVSALAPLSCGSCCIIQVDAAHWWWLRRDHPHMIVKHLGCTTIHNKAQMHRSFIHIPIRISDFSNDKLESGQNHLKPTKAIFIFHQNTFIGLKKMVKNAQLCIKSSN